MKLPGIIYSLILAVAAWAVDYFTSGAGAGFPWAPVLVAAVPVLLKLIAPGEDAPAEEAAGVGTRGIAPAQGRSYISKVLWG